jgi:hypothetical protein
MLVAVLAVLLLASLAFAQNGLPSSKATAQVNMLVKCNMTGVQVVDGQEVTLPGSCVDLFTGASVATKNQWIKITKGNTVAYAQWEDVGPFQENDAAYVFGTARPRNAINNHAGLDLSPAVATFLNLQDIDTVSWQFVNAGDVPDGPWKQVVTTSQIDWE